MDKHEDNERDAEQEPDEYRDDINAFQEAVADALLRPYFVKALHAILYGDDQLRAACDMRREVKLAIFAYEQERIPGAPSAISRRLTHSTVRAAAERLAADMRSGRALGIPQHDDGAKS